MWLHVSAPAVCMLLTAAVLAPGVHGVRPEVGPSKPTPSERCSAVTSTTDEVGAKCCPTYPAANLDFGTYEYHFDSPRCGEGLVCAKGREVFYVCWKDWGQPCTAQKDCMDQAAYIDLVWPADKGVTAKIGFQFDIAPRVGAVRCNRPGGATEGAGVCCVPDIDWMHAKAEDALRNNRPLQDHKGNPLPSSCCSKNVRWPQETGWKRFLGGDYWPENGGFDKQWNAYQRIANKEKFCGAPA